MSKTVKCGWCERKHVSNAQESFCSLGCRRKAFRQVSSAVKRKAKVIEPVRLLTVYNRDQGICQICGVFIPWTNKQSPEMPTRDHIVPISQGGEHTYANIRLAHQKCNLARHAMSFNKHPYWRRFFSWANRTLDWKGFFS